MYQWSTEQLFLSDNIQLEYFNKISYVCNYSVVSRGYLHLLQTNKETIVSQVHGPGAGHMQKIR